MLPKTVDAQRTFYALCLDKNTLRFYLVRFIWIDSLIIWYPIVIPSAEAIIAFNALVTPMLEQIAIKNKENKNLVTMRDILLPRLMSGELDLSDIDP